MKIKTSNPLRIRGFAPIATAAQPAFAEATAGDAEEEGLRDVIPLRGVSSETIARLATLAFFFGAISRSRRA